MTEEIQTCLMLFAGGFFVSALYDLYRRLWLVRYRRSWKKHLGDTIFALLASVVVILLLFYTNWGELRSYVFLGLWIGIFTYFKLVKLILSYFR